jgi:hypothetical protein
LKFINVELHSHSTIPKITPLAQEGIWLALQPNLENLLHFALTIFHRLLFKVRVISRARTVPKHGADLVLEGFNCVPKKKQEQRIL